MDNELTPPSEEALRRAVEEARRRHPKPPKVKVINTPYPQAMEVNLRRLYKKGWGCPLQCR